MNIKCNYCEATANGTQAELMDKGWSRARFYAPVRKTLTACPKHQNELATEVSKIFERIKKKRGGKPG